MKPIAMDVKRKMLKDVGATALVIFEYYDQAIHYDDYLITDKRVADALGVSVSTVQRARLKLRQFNYFFEVSSKTKVMETYLYALGKVEVVKAKYFNNLFGQQNPYEVRKKFSKSSVCKILDGSALTHEEQEDVMEALVPSTADEKKYATGDWCVNA